MSGMIHLEFTFLTAILTEDVGSLWSKVSASTTTVWSLPSSSSQDIWHHKSAAQSMAQACDVRNFPTNKRKRPFTSGSSARYSIHYRHVCSRSPSVSSCYASPSHRCTSGLSDSSWSSLQLWVSHTHRWLSSSVNPSPFGGT